MRSFIDSLDTADILALFAGVVVTSAFLIMAVVFGGEERALILGALITIDTLVFNHFFQKKNAEPPTSE